MRKAFKYRLRTSQTVEQQLDRTLSLCRYLYNGALQERRDAYKIARKSISYVDQANQLPDIKEVCPEYQSVYSQVLQETLGRVKKAFDGFFRRVKRNNGKAGYPRFRGANRYDSFTYPQGGWKLDGDKLWLSKIGSVRLRLSRPVEGKIKTVTIKKECGKWFAIFSCEVEPEPLPPTGNAIGIDLGLKYFIATSDGEVVDAPKFLRQSEEKLAKAQRQLAKKKLRSNRRKKAKTKVIRIYQRISNQRKDWLHKLSTRLIRENDIICYENLNIAGMVKNHRLAKSISDAAWGMFVNMIVYKAVWAGRLDVDVYAPGTTIECSGCGEEVPKTLSTRLHQCPKCGFVLCRDWNAARNILARGLSVLASGQGVTARGGLALAGPENRESSLGCELPHGNSLPAYS